MYYIDLALNKQLDPATWTFSSPSQISEITGLYNDIHLGYN